MRRALLSLLALLALHAGAAAPAAAQIVRNFTPRFTTNVPGDVALIGNTVMSCTGGGNCTNARNGNGGNIDDNDHNMQYVDIDADGTTFSSSSATLTLPAGATVLWAGLYWGGVSGTATRNQVRLATPVAGYVTLTAAQLDVAAGNIYQGYLDVTAGVLAGGNGTYTVANVLSTTGTNNFAGWSLVVAYRDAAAPQRNLTIFDGFAEVAPGAAVTIPVSGFLTPPAGAVNTRLGVVAYEGDLGLTGDQFQLNGTALGNATNPANNFFNSSISRAGVTVTTKNPNYLNQLGFDVDQLNLTNAIPNGATSATLRLSSTDDRYYPGVVSFATDLYIPIISGSGFTKGVADLNGAPARPGDLLEYTVALANTGLDGAVQTVVSDTLPANASYVPGSLVVLSGANAGAKTDAAGDDQAEYDATARRVVFRAGTGANAATGGTLAVGASTSLRFRVSITPPAPNGSVVANRAAAAFNGAQLGTTFSTLSDADTLTPGQQTTNVTVVAPRLSGTVFEDASYGGGAGRSLAAAAGTVRPGVRVELYDAAGVLVAADTTDAAGLWLFDGWPAGAYTVRATELTVTSARPGATPGLLPVLSFRTNATTGAAVADGSRVGGEDPRLSDAALNTSGLTLAALTTALARPQAIAPVTLGTADIAGVDFGFNFDLVVNANDAGRGSLRQFIVNANALGNAGLAQAGLPPGAETAIFMGSDGLAHPGLRAGLPSVLTTGVLRITPATALPAITGPATRIDGTRQTANVGDTNAGARGGGGTVGVDALALAALARPEVEIADVAAIDIGLSLQASGVELVGLSVTGFGSIPDQDAHANVLVGAGAASALVERCVLGGSAAAFADPGAAARSGGDNLRVVGGDNGIARDNLIGFAAGSGVALVSASDGWQLTGNEIRGNAIGQPQRDGIAGSSGTSTVRGNRVADNGGNGIDTRSGSGGQVVENNTVTGNGRAVGGGAETAGLRMGGNGNRVDRNVVSGNYGAGVMVVAAAQTNTVTRNSIWGNGAITNLAGGGPSGQVGIDLLAAADDAAAGTSPFVTLDDPGDADAGANGLLNYPVLESAVLLSGNLTLTGWARPGSTIELFAADPDPSGFGEGRTYLATLVEGSPTDLDGSASAIPSPLNGLAQGADNTNRFRFTLATPPGVLGGTTLTATATIGLATSEFSGLVTVQSGVTATVSGVAYADADHDAGRDPAETGTGVAIWAKLVLASAPAVAQSVVAVTPATGDYAFTLVAPGTYTILLDDNALATDVAAAYPPGWIGTEAPTGVRAGVVVSAADVGGLDFGLWHGGRVDGRVHRDDGAAGGTPNDGARQAGEAGVAGVRVRLTSAACAGSACDSTLTDGAGAFALWYPDAAAGAAATLREVNPAGWLSTGGGAGTTGGAYARPADAVGFTPAAGTVYTGVAFGDVPPNALQPNGARSGTPGAVVFHPHTFTAGSGGTVSFTLSQSPSPAIPGWAATLIHDLDCDGTPEAGEPALAGPVAVSAGQTLCLLVRHQIPAGAPDGATESIVVDAGFDYINAAPALVAAVTASDLTTVSGGGALEVVKSVDLSSARPGDLLTYTITYRNLGADAVSTIVIQDATPPWTTFDTAACGTLGPGLAGCALTTAPTAGASGPVIWTMTGSLSPGGQGTVSFRVRVQ